MKKIASDVKLGKNVKIYDFVNLYGCEIGDNTKIGTFVEIQKGATIGKNCKISSHTFICEGVTIEDNVFVGHNVAFINDKYPKATNEKGELQNNEDWKVEPTMVKRGASIGSGSTILSYVTIGENATIGAGSVVTKDVAPNTIVAGNPAQLLRTIEKSQIASNQKPNAAERFMKVPFLDLKVQYDSIKDEINAAIQEVLDSCAFAGGPLVEKFEKEFAKFCDCKYAMGVGSGTEALWLSLLALGIGPGDEVVTVPNTFIATAEAISFCGAKPVFVDIDEKTYTMDPQKLEDYLKIRNSQSPIRNRPKAVIPVHIFGQTADMDPIINIARKHRLFVLEDACQAHGAVYKGRPAGSIGDAGCFSFYPGKNLGAYGEAGAVTTNNSELAEKIATLRDHGQSKKYYHNRIGWNARMDGLQGAVLSVKLNHLPAWNKARREKAMIYNDLLSGIDNMILPYEANDTKHVYHIYAIRTQNRDRLINFLREKDIHCAIHYPISVHLQKAYQYLGYSKGSFSVAERCAEEIVSLPMFAELTLNQINAVTIEISNFLSR